MNTATLLGQDYNYYAHAAILEPIIGLLASDKTKVKTSWRSGKVRYGTFAQVFDSMGWYLVPNRAHGGYQVSQGLLKIELKEGNNWTNIWEIK